MPYTPVSRRLFEPCNRCNSKARRGIIDFDLQLFAGEKTEEPTAKRRADAKKKGQVAKSQEINAAFIMLTGFFLLKSLGGDVMDEIMNYSTHIFSNMMVTVDEESVMQLFIGVSIVLIKTAIPVMLCIMVVGLAINMAQVGINFNTEAIEFKLDKLNPITGFGRIFSKRSLVELLKSLIKIVVIGFFIYDYLKEEIVKMPTLIYTDLFTAANQIADVVFTLAFQVCGVFFIMAVLDLIYQQWQMTQDLKMSKQDIKDEFKQQEGDPQIKGKIKGKQRQMAMARMMQEVPKADVIITNPTHFAVAMQYNSGMEAPVVLAKGQDHVAMRIKEIAKEHRIPIVENKPLARALYATVEVGMAIPQELYKSVAEVLAYVYRLKNKGRRSA